MSKSLGSELNAMDWTGGRHAALSPREREVMSLAAKGFANKAIARQLSVAEGTVKLHLHRVYQKLGIKSRFALAVLARKSPGNPRKRHDSDIA
jgi:two-component system nitrate/nitrite response regulator NarL